MIARQIAFRHFPHIDKDAASHFGCHIGLIGEHLVAARLISWGYNTIVVGNNLPYDLITEVGHQTVRIQVKSKLGGNGDSWTFDLTPSSAGRTKDGPNRYARTDFHLAALVVLRMGYVSFTASAARSFEVRIPTARMLDPDYERHQFEALLFDVGALSKEQFHALRGHVGAPGPDHT
ncbi:group I intron-associated PD-(D/E)XK endonuclease [Zavarzinia compransoris]|uniref:group I intron-associated PD-(D/E)XK endonuclease n=1 Tax=Zavarzinia compransoris TaxID=1264899 RepID=UPI00105B978C|nr:group I intron-associated PD-(D/E)XK endonuclease [Zavarzinia compransoris]